MATSGTAYFCTAELAQPNQSWARTLFQLAGVHKPTLQANGDTAGHCAVKLAIPEGTSIFQRGGSPAANAAEGRQAQRIVNRCAVPPAPQTKTYTANENKTAELQVTEKRREQEKRRKQNRREQEKRQKQNPKPQNRK